MRLISMSAHTRLKGKQKPLKNFQQTLSKLFNEAKIVHPQWNNQLFNPVENTEKHLVILIGSQKGLCGNFNSSLFYYVDEDFPELLQKKASFIAIGKKAADYLLHKKNITPLVQYKNVTTATIATIAHSIIDFISNSQPVFESVMIYSNQLKTFFVQKPSKLSLIPFIADEVANATSPKTDYEWEQDPNEILDYLAKQLLVVNVEYLLFESLLAEQAARFISMDSSTRNANNLLDQTKLTYNKLRQANITKELSELTGNF